MEQIVYCQDKVYQSSLQKVREKDTEDEKKNKKTSSLAFFGSAPPEDSSMAEIFQHLVAYHEVSLQATRKGGLRPSRPF